MGDGFNMGGRRWGRESWMPAKFLARAAGCMVGPLTIMESIGKMTDLMGKEHEFISVHVDVKVSVGHSNRDV